MAGDQNPRYRSGILAKWAYIFVFLLTKFSIYGGCCRNEFGWTYPDDIILREGQPLKLFCTINVENQEFKNSTAKNLEFHEGNQIVDKRYVTEVNETTIRLDMKTSTESKYWYFCYWKKNKTDEESSRPIPGGGNIKQPTESKNNEKLICAIQVEVGKEPKKAENITCVSINLESLKCSWDVPKNYVKTNYTIQYFPKHQRDKPIKCPNDDDIKHNNCTWTLLTNPIYRKSQPKFQIMVTGQNEFGKTKHEIGFDHFAHVRPNAPENLISVNRTSTNIRLQWYIGDLHTFSPGWNYSISYNISNHKDDDDKEDNNIWYKLYYCPDPEKETNEDHNIVVFDVPNLIPYKCYNFRIRMKSKIATDSYFSKQYATGLFCTLPTAPSHPPQTDTGLFQFEEGSTEFMRTVYIYWQCLSPNEYFGNNFHYEIQAFTLNDSCGAVNCLPSEQPAIDVENISINNSFAKYRIGRSAYKFHIWSKNSVGISPNFSSIVVPSCNDRVKPCTSLSKIDYGDYNYRLSWQPPQHTESANEEITGYTIFWCQTDNVRPYQCDGLLAWHYLPASDGTKYNKRMNSSNYQFAVSAHTAHSSSGMLWTTCTVLPGMLGTVKEITAVSTGSTYIHLGWKVECWDEVSNITAIHVEYCELKSHNDTHCSAPWQNITWLGNIGLKTGNLTNLKPYTYYRVRIRLCADTETGGASSPYTFRTLEGAPDVDGLIIKEENKSDVAVTISWQPPKVANASSLHYDVFYHRVRDKHVKLNLKADRQPFTIKNLDSYTEYNISLQVCTAKCSMYAKPIIVQTKIGKPGQPRIKPLDIMNNSTVEVCWDPPVPLAGPNPVYELIMKKDGVEELSINISNATRYTIPVPDCNSDKATSYEFQVRAVNYDLVEPDNTTSTSTSSASSSSSELEQHVGNWSSVLTHNCAVHGLSTMWKVLAFIVFVPFFTVVLYYTCSRVYKRCQSMRKVATPTLPRKFLIPFQETSDCKRNHHSSIPLLKFNLVEKPIEPILENDN